MPKFKPIGCTCKILKSISLHSLPILGYEDPIWSKKSETDSSYHRVLGCVLERVREGRASVMIGTQNEATVTFALEK